MAEQIDLFQATATIEHSVAHRRAVDGRRRERVATVKHSPANAGHAGWHIDTLQRCAPVKCISANTGHTVTQRHLGQGTTSRHHLLADDGALQVGTLYMSTMRKRISLNRGHAGRDRNLNKSIAITEGRITDRREA